MADNPPTDEKGHGPGAPRSRREPGLGELALKIIAAPVLVAINLVSAWVGSKERPRTERVPRGYQTYDDNVRWIGWLALATVVAAVVMHLTLGGFLALLERRAVPTVPHAPLAERSRIPPEPRLQVSPPQDLRRMRAEEEQVLHSYGWEDPQKGIVRIPIERAIDLLSRRGLPVVSSQGAGEKRP